MAQNLSIGHISQLIFITFLYKKIFCYKWKVLLPDQVSICCLTLTLLCTDAICLFSLLFSLNLDWHSLHSWDGSTWTTLLCCLISLGCGKALSQIEHWTSWDSSECFISKWYARSAFRWNFFGHFSHWNLIPSFSWISFWCCLKLYFSLNSEPHIKHLNSLFKVFPWWTFLCLWRWGSVLNCLSHWSQLKLTIGPVWGSDDVWHLSEI